MSPGSGPWVNQEALAVSISCEYLEPLSIVVWFYDRQPKKYLKKNA